MRHANPRQLRRRRRRVDGKRCIGAIAASLTILGLAVAACSLASLLFSHSTITVQNGGAPPSLEEPRPRLDGLRERRGGQLEESHEGRLEESREGRLPSLELAHERSFSDTLKSCVPDGGGGTKDKCLRHIPEGSAPRIGILSPPGRIPDAFADWLDGGLSSAGASADDFVVLPTSHVPPYGYGRSHGWTKIVRLATVPLVLGAVDAATHWGGDARRPRERKVVRGRPRGEVSESFPHREAPPAAALAPTLRQIVRWHCRLSHVSAHTAMLTVTLPGIVQRPKQTMDELLSFIMDGNPSGAGGNADVLEGKVSPSSDVKIVQAVVDATYDQIRSLFPNEDVSGERPGASLDTVLQRLDSALGKELSATKNLSDWPCRSFWDVTKDADERGGSPGELMRAAKLMARSLAPNCTEEYTKCTVRKDLCEESGDALCKR